MKKLFKYIFLVALCFALSGCKSSRAKETDRLIDAIGDVTLEKHAEIKAAQEAYGQLSYEDKQKVDFVKLDKAVEKFRYLQFAGKWKNINQINDYIVFNDDGTLVCMLGDMEVYSGSYRFIGDTIDLDYTSAGGSDIYSKEAFTIEYIQDMPHLVNVQGGNYIKEDDYSVSVVDITNENWQEYFDIEYRFDIDLGGSGNPAVTPKKIQYNGYLVLKKEFADRLHSAEESSAHQFKVMYDEVLEYKEYRWDRAKQEPVFIRTRLVQDGDLNPCYTNFVTQYDMWLSATSGDRAMAIYSFNGGSPLKGDIYDVGIPQEYETVVLYGSLLLYDKPVFDIKY